MMRRGIPILMMAVMLLAPAVLAADYVNAGPADGMVSPGVWFLAQEIRIESITTPPVDLISVKVWNTGAGNPIVGADVDRIEVRRGSDGSVMGTASTSAQLAALATTGVVITTNQNRSIAEEGTVRIWVRLKSTAPLGRVLQLGDTLVTSDEDGVPGVVVDYTQAAAVLTVGPPPGVAFDGSVADQDVYRGQRFLAGRIRVDASNVPFEVTIERILLWNAAAAGTPIAGEHIQQIEIRRASDDGLLRIQSTAAELAKLTTTTGVPFTSLSNNKVGAYSVLLLEVWVTLKANAPAPQVLQLRAQFRVNGADVPSDPAQEAPTFTVDLPQGFEEVLNSPDITGGQVFSGQRFLAQRVECHDNDIDPFDVTITAVIVSNVADATDRLAENQIDKIEAIRASDGAVMGTVTGASALNSGGVRINTTTNNVVLDDMTESIEIWITLKSNVPHDRKIRLQTKVWHTEDGEVYGKLADNLDSAEFITGPQVGQGFERSTADSTVTSRQVFQGARFLAQRLKLEDDDQDPYDVLITSIMVRNAAPDSKLADQNVAQLEVRRRSDGALLGQVIDPVGLSLAGVRVTIDDSNRVPDDTTVELEIWVTLKQTAPAGRKLLLESIVWHSEGTATFETAPPLQGPGTFTTKIGTAPQNVDFGWTPSGPSAQDEITFTPAGNITDPEGSIANAAFQWDFGDGELEQTEGPAPVTHTFAAAGTYAVTLTVTGKEGIAAAPRTHDVVVAGLPPVIASITANPESPAVGESVALSAVVTPEGGTVTYAWNFGDGGTSTAAAPSHTYTEAGTYEVALTVTTPQGGTATRTVEISVGNEPPTLSGVTATPATAGTGDVVEFRATGYADADEDPVDRYEWIFGDGTTRTAGEAVETHVYTAPGTYTVSVVAVDARGARSVARTVQVTVSGPERAIVYGYPNPARTTATIAYFLPEGASSPELHVFNMAGRRILVQALAAEEARYDWDLRDGDGEAIASGLYFCMIVAKSAGNRTITSQTFRLLVSR